MPITLSFDIKNKTISSNDRQRIISMFAHLGWEHIGGSAWRYPELGAKNASEDWFNQVIPALMFFRGVIRSKNCKITKFTLDAHSEAGYRRNSPVPLSSILEGVLIAKYPEKVREAYKKKLSKKKIEEYVDGCDLLTI